MRALALSGLALLATACGGDELLVPVTLTLDSSTCTTKAAGQINFSCNSAVGAWVRRGDPAEPDTVDDACVDFASDGADLAGLPGILSQSVDLSGLSGGELWLEMAVFSPASAADGCPDVSAFSDQMAVYGRTVTTEISGTSRGLTVELFCYAVDDGSTEDACTTDCNEEHDYCPDAFESGPCDLDYDDCFAACPVDDEPCYALCDGAYDTCIEDQPTPCSDAEDLCYDGCAGDLTCEDDCCNGYYDCVMANCETAHTVCLGRCSAMQDSCASAI